MDFAAYLSDIRHRFPDKEFLLVEDIAVMLSKSPKAARSFIERGNLPAARKRGGRIGVTVGEMAEYLMLTSQSFGRKPTIQPKPTGFILKPRSSRQSFASLIAQARLQAEFASMLADALERISLRGQDTPFERDNKSL
jgi:hypothetical protein